MIQVMGSGYSVIFKKKKIHPVNNVIIVKEKEDREDVVDKKDILCIREGYTLKK